MLKKVSSAIEYVSWLYKYNLELQKVSNCIFRLEKIEKNANGEYIANVQVINKFVGFRCNVNDIVSNDQLMECFSKIDVKEMTRIATIHSLRPTSRIVSYEYDESGRMIVNMKTENSDKPTQFTLNSISNDPIILRTLDQVDASRIGSLAEIYRSYFKMRISAVFHQKF